MTVTLRGRGFIRQVEAAGRHCSGLCPDQMSSEKATHPEAVEGLQRTGEQGGQQEVLLPRTRETVLKTWSTTEREGLREPRRPYLQGREETPAPWLLAQSSVCPMG